MFANLLLEGAREEEKHSGSLKQDIPVLLTHLTESEAINAGIEPCEVCIGE